jgi:two-component system cell cycle sensor histidine kinase/response regulator CckA
MNGPAVAAAVQQICPDISVIYMSGYTDKAIADQGLLGAERVLLSKPFTPDALERAIRQALDRPTQVAP